MPHSNIPSRLIGRIEDIQRDARQLASLKSLVAVISLPFVYDGLKRETYSTAADAWIQIAKSVLQRLMVDRPQLVEDAGLKADLVEHLGAGDMRPDQAEAREAAAEFADSLVGGWIEILRRSTPGEKKVPLDETLIPKGTEFESWHSLMKHVAASSVARSEVEQILRLTRDKLFKSEPSVELPLGIILTRESHERGWFRIATDTNRDEYYAMSTRQFWDLKRQND